MGLYPRAIEAVLEGVPRGPSSNVFLVDPVLGSDANLGDRWTKPLATIAEAYSRCVANQHDVVLLLATSGGFTLDAPIVWAKNFTHLIGMSAPSHVGQRARIFQAAALVGASPLIDFAATGCVFKDFYVFQGVDDATSLVDARLSGGRNYFKNVHFAGGGHATQAIDGGASLLIAGGSENFFERCTIGVDTIAAGNGMAGLVYAATGGAARNKFKECHFSLFAGHAGAIFVELLGNAGLDRYHIFDDCLFTNLSATAMTQAVAVAAGFDPANKRLLMKDCSLLGATDWNSGDTGLVALNNGTITGGGNAGTMLASVVA